MLNKNFIYRSKFQMESNLIITCPYNKAHRIAKAKLMHHVTKCKENVCTENFVECPLDKSHIIQGNKLKVCEQNMCNI